MVELVAPISKHFKLIWNILGWILIIKMINQL